MFLRTAFYVPRLVSKIENRQECIVKKKICKIHEGNFRSESEKDNIPWPKNNASHVVKVFVELILWEFVTHIYSDILHWYKGFSDKVYLSKENSSVLLLIWTSYNQCLQIFVKLTDHNMFQTSDFISLAKPQEQEPKLKFIGTHYIWI